MTILGIGTEIVECLRIRRMISEHGELFLLRVFSQREIQFCQERRQSTEHFAIRWAAKEAICKAIGIAGQRNTWAEIETEIDPGKGMHAVIRGGTRDWMEGKGIRDVLVTTSYCRAYATATAIAVSG